MPLLDHFHPPLSIHRHWDGFHSKWAGAIVDRLNDDLPPRYFAEPHIHLGTQIEVDVGTFESAIASADSPATATLVSAPPTLSLALPATEQDLVEVQVYNDEAGPRLVAAIELVSPANKDRLTNRHAFAVKCASCLYRGVGLIVVDVVTSRNANVHHDVLQALDLAMEGEQPEGSLFSAAYRTRQDPQQPMIDIWLEQLAVGGVLPSLPLWLDAESAVTVDLDDSYAATCRALRIEH